MNTNIIMFLEKKYGDNVLVTRRKSTIGFNTQSITVKLNRTTIIKKVQS